MLFRVPIAMSLPPWCGMESGGLPGKSFSHIGSFPLFTFVRPSCFAILSRSLAFWGDRRACSIRRMIRSNFLLFMIPYVVLGWMASFLFLCQVISGNKHFRALGFESILSSGAKVQHGSRKRLAWKLLRRVHFSPQRYILPPRHGPAPRFP